MTMKTHHILLTITTSKDIKDLVDHVAGRAYTLDGVTNVTGVDVTLHTGPAIELNSVELASKD